MNNTLNRMYFNYKENNRFHKLLIIFILFTSFCTPFKLNADSVDTMITLFRDSANLYQNTSQEVFFLQKGLQFATKHKDHVNESLFLYHLTRNYYNRWIPDSTKYWGEKGVDVAQKYGCYNELFDIMGLLCLRDIFMENYDIAYDRATELYKLSEKENQPEGMIASYEVMGILYRQTSRPKKALESYKEGLKLLNNTVKRPSQKLQFIGYIIEILLNQGDTSNAKSYIDDYQNLIDDYSKNKYIKYGMISLDRCCKLLECFLTDYHIQRREYEQAKDHYLAAVKFNQVNDVYVQYYFDMNTISYHHYITKSLPVALTEVDRLLAEENTPQMLLQKADILFDMGRFPESVNVYKSVIHLKDSISDYELNSQLNSLQTRLDVNKLELEKRDLEAKRSELKIHIVYLVLIFVLIILLFVVVTLIRISKVKNILKKNAKDLKIAKERAEESNRMKTIFIQNMSHEIRTPLNAIVGFSSLLAEIPEEGKQFSPLIEENSNLLLKLIDDLLNTSMIEAHNQTSLSIESFDLTDCCRKAIDSVCTLVPPNVQITFHPGCPHLKMKTDPLRLHQVLINLLTNALKYTNEGDIDIAFQMMNDKNHVSIVVTDNGDGVPEDKREAIFERFVKLDSFKQGSGLGLYICRNIVTAMHGRIYLDAEYHDGARFITELPLIVDE